MVMRLYLLVSGAAILAVSTAPLALTDGAESLLQPLARLGMPVRETVLMLALALRFLPTLAEEAHRIGEAQASRSGEFAAAGRLRRPGNWLPLLVPVVTAAFRRGDDLATAMESRCYRGCAGRTKLRRLTFSGRDLTCTGGMVLLLLLVLLIERQLV
jgi:energy-coupling factor transport system permease protein